MLPTGNENTGDDEETLPGIAATVVTFSTLTVAFVLLGLGVSAFWVAFPIGFGGLLPLSVVLAKVYESNRAGTDEHESTPASDDQRDDALATLRDRYARGEISEAEFEERVERLLETESLDSADSLLGGSDEHTNEDSATDSQNERELA